MQEKILIIESNKTLAGLWQAYLVKHGFDAICAIDGESKDPLANWGFPDVIVSGLDFDRHIPTGADYCIKALGTKPLHGNLIPVIQLSTTPLPKSVKDSLEGSAFKIIEKPLPLPCLLDAVREAAFAGLAAALRRSGAATMSANLQGHTLSGMLQSIDSGAKSGTVLVESPAGKACIRLRKAAFVDARCGSLSGPEAVLEALSWDEGSASFHEGQVHPGKDKGIMWPDIRNLTSESLRQREIVERAGKLLSTPSATLQRNPSAKIGGKAPFSERIFIALETPCDFETLSLRLRQLSRRQLLVSVEGMLERGELVLSSDSGPEGLNAQIRQTLVETLLDKEACEKAISLPPAIAVSSLTAKLAKRFIGATCGAPFASAALITAGRQHVLLCECLAEDIKPDALPAGGLLLIFDRLDTGSIGKFRELSKRLKSGDKARILIASPDLPEQRTTTSTAELLGLEEESNLASFDFSRESCAATIAELLNFELKKDAPFTSVSI